MPTSIPLVIFIDQMFKYFMQIIIGDRSNEQPLNMFLIDWIFEMPVKFSCLELLSLETWSDNINKK